MSSEVLIEQGAKTGQEESVELVDGLECLTFNLGEESFGVDILRVQEIRAWEEVARIPNSPEYVLGVFNLRGSIVPVIDLRLRLGMEFREYDKETVVVILKVSGAEKERSVGVVVDEVSDVFIIDRSMINDAPDFGDKLDTQVFSGITEAEGKMITLLQTDMLPPGSRSLEATKN